MKLQVSKTNKDNIVTINSTKDGDWFEYKDQLFVRICMQGTYEGIPAFNFTANRTNYFTDQNTKVQMVEEVKVEYKL